MPRRIQKSGWARRASFVVVLVAVVLLPRIARMRDPNIWVEDESYLTGALALSHGLLPYRDFPLPHLPMLEALAGTAFTVASPSIRVAETLTQVAAAAGAVLIFVLGRAIADEGTGLAAALIFSTSPLLFRYHVFEREVFVVVPVVGAVALWARGFGARRPGLAAAVTGVLLGLALAIKLTAIAAVAGLVAYLVTTGRRQFAGIAGGIALATVGLMSAALFAVFGSDFVVQVILFRLLHATFPSLGVKIDEMRFTLDVAFALGVSGVVLILLTERGRRGGVRQSPWMIVLCQLASAGIFLVLLNPTYWAHTGIELLPWLSLCGGYLIAAGVGSLFQRKRLPTLIACAALAAALLLFVSPIRNLNWEAGDGSPFGFGYRDRREIETAASYVRNHSAPDDAVATPPIVALEANRREVVPYPEIAGEIQAIADAVRREGYVKALGDPTLGRGTFWESVEESGRLIAPRLADAIRRREPAIVINDSPDDLMPVQFVDIPPEDLKAAGYALESVTPHYEIWLRR
jgi:hypothetical protein